MQNRLLTYILLLIAIVISLWIGVDVVSQFRAGIIYFAIASVSLMAYIILGSKYEWYIINPQHIITDGLIGLFFGLFWIFGSYIFPSLSIGIPDTSYLSFSSVARSLVVVGLAPIVEELGIKGAFGLFFKSTSRIPIFLIVIITSLIFAGLHWFVAGSSLASSSILISAFLFCILTWLIVLWRKSLTGAYVAHLVYNSFVAVGGLVIV